MAQWNKTPAWTELENIMTEQATRKTGLTAEQFNAIVENIQYLKNSTALEVKQESGQSTTAVMSQKAVTDAINNAITTTLNTAV